MCRNPNLDEIELPTVKGKSVECMYGNLRLNIRCDNEGSWNLHAYIDGDYLSTDFAATDGGYNLRGPIRSQHGVWSDWRQLVRDAVMRRIDTRE